MLDLESLSAQLPRLCDRATLSIFRSTPNENPLRVLLYNSDYFTTGIRHKIEFTLSGIPASSVSEERLTADMATIAVGKGNITVAGQSFKEDLRAAERGGHGDSRGSRWRCNFPRWSIGGFGH
ncbi:hypothetical protein ANOM_011871 [Aspergillus nomiae NRRL 13137]|uniref:Beta-glucuronidase C-terminal domain-containing protein n=1 Tax=Aspergillus nomiae NRRL (strain ATCC 15546 / NRRL 13137 / CBS 260.88 / M93) TaxID=1509407 RepID=A0A0L1IKW3_ASPN3|nr:uncharacterized protein ANOM_011871 [Aspergillus nomiae NRRL 13137]KNG79833.1 hypothetical protein ANOM_011871 [Aspergillus nomiae NRRL 13137]